MYKVLSVCTLHQLCKPLGLSFGTNKAIFPHFDSLPTTGGLLFSINAILPVNNKHRCLLGSEGENGSLLSSFPESFYPFSSPSEGSKQQQQQPGKGRRMPRCGGTET